MLYLRRHIRGAKAFYAHAFFLLILSAHYSCSDSSTITAVSPEAAPATPGPGEPTLTLKPNEQSVTLQQISRMLHKQDFTTEILEQFKDSVDLGKLSPPIIDILMVIDNSGSMSEEQANLSTKLEFLLSSIKEMNWQINVITTDSSCPTHKELPLKSVPGQTDITDQQKNIFKAAVVPGTSGHWDEIGVQATIAHLTPKAWDKGGSYPACPPQPVWIRKKESPAAKLAVIFVTDENEYMKKPQEQRPLIVKEMLDLLVNLGYAPGKDAQFFGMIWSPEVTKKAGEYNPCRPDQPSEVQYDLINTTKGKMGDICDTDYANTLSQISKAISKMAESKIPLTHPQPIAATIQVIQDDYTTLDPSEWRYERTDNAVTLKGSLKAGSTYDVLYKTDEHRIIALEAPANESTIKVTIAGQRAKADTYIYKPDDHSLYFRTPIEEGVKVSINFRDEGELLKEFAFPDVGSKPITCSLNGQKVEHLYFPSDGVIAFVNGLADGEKAICRY